MPSRPKQMCAGPRWTTTAAAVVAGVALMATTAGVQAQASAPVMAAAPPPPASVESKVIPAPRPGDLAAETAHVQRYDAAIAAVRDQTISAADVERLKRALARVSAMDGIGTRIARDEIDDPIARKIVDWYRLRGGVGEAREYREWLAANPAWPNRELMVQRHEEAIFTEGGPARAVKDHFKAEPPRTAAGIAAIASALLAEGDEKGATSQARRAWREFPLGSTLETGFLERFGKLLGPADHKWRLDKLLLDDPRWSSDRTERAAMARRLLPLLPEAERKKAEARLAVFLRAGNAAALMNALPADDKDKPDWGLVFQRIQLLRRQDKIDEAARRMLAVPLEGDALVSPDGWWGERRVLIFALLRTGNPKLAYELAKAAGPLSINPQKDQTFHAGWLALSHLKDARTAERHFGELRRIADGPLSRAKAGYWHGRALEALGRRRDAEAAWRESAGSPDTFHGHLSREKLGADARLHIVPPKAPTPQQVARFSAFDAARAAVITRKAKLEVGLTRAFLGGLSRHLDTEAEIGMVAHLAEALGDTQMAVRVAKSGVARGHNLLVFSYPLHAFPSFTALRIPTPEPALLLGIARQESEFNGQTMSGAGARGILQVMPITARHVCKDYKIKCDIPRLMKDDSYNTMMGATYIGDRMREFGGSYVLGFAGYNAGPGRARQWIREFGDPRAPRVDPIDWIHRIPFEETREYVMKVMSNVQVYRARLGSGPSRLMIAQDLVRARGETAVPAGQAGAPERSGETRRGEADSGRADKVFE
jgi:soluble lytic murein transglycosylase